MRLTPTNEAQITVYKEPFCFQNLNMANKLENNKHNK